MARPAAAVPHQPDLGGSARGDHRRATVDQPQGVAGEGGDPCRGPESPNASRRRSRAQGSERAGTREQAAAQMDRRDAPGGGGLKAADTTGKIATVDCSAPRKQRSLDVGCDARSGCAACRSICWRRGVGYLICQAPGYLRSSTYQRPHRRHDGRAVPRPLPALRRAGRCVAEPPGRGAAEPQPARLPGMHALYDALQAHLAQADPAVRGWQDWLDALASPPASRRGAGARGRSA